MKPNVLPFIREKSTGVTQPTQSWASKTVLVTGADVGLGFEAAAKFASLDAQKVILAVRDISKGNTAKKQIEARNVHDKDTVIDVCELDMNNYDSIQRLAPRAEEELARIDAVILNAGVTLKDYTVGSERWESTLQVNVLGTAPLGLLLLPKLRTSSSETGYAHLVIVTSEVHRWLEGKDFPDATLYNGPLLAAVNAKPADLKTWDGMLQNARS